MTTLDCGDKESLSEKGTFISGDLRDEEEWPLMHISEQMTHQVGASWAKALGCDSLYGSSGDEAGSSTW